MVGSCASSLALMAWAWWVVMLVKAHRRSVVSCFTVQMLTQVKLMFLFNFSHVFPFMNSYFFGESNFYNGSVSYLPIPSRRLFC